MLDILLIFTGNVLNVLSVMDIDWPMTELYRMRMGQDVSIKIALRFVPAY